MLHLPGHVAGHPGPQPLQLLPVQPRPLQGVHQQQDEDGREAPGAAVTDKHHSEPNGQT